MQAPGSTGTGGAYKSGITDTKSKPAPTPDTRLPGRAGLIDSDGSPRTLADWQVSVMQGPTDPVTTKLLGLFKPGYGFSVADALCALDDYDQQKIYDAAALAGRVSLADVPVRHRSLEVCAALVAQSRARLHQVPKEIQAGNRQLCEAALSLRDSHGHCLGDLSEVPARFHDDAMFELAVTSDGENLQHIPADRRSQALSSLAVANSWRALEHVPADQRSAELCDTAYRQDKMAFRYFPETQMSPARCNEAVRHNDLLLDSVPPAKRTEENYANAYLSSGRKAFLAEQALDGSQVGRIRALAEQLEPQRFKDLGL